MKVEKLDSQLRPRQSGQAPFTSHPRLRSTRVRVIRSRGRHVADVSGQDLPTTTTSRRCRRILSLAFPNTSVHTTTSGTQVSPGVGPATLRQVTRLVATGCRCAAERRKRERKKKIRVKAGPTRIHVPSLWNARHVGNGVDQLFSGEKAGRVSDCILRRVADVAGSGQGHFRESLRPKTL
ncbi:hypothetical protein BHE74_00015555 [Ensete ventricosum]|nr:hypothetical protein BHE74_00015555 [Ensete ventricosum]